MCFSSRVNLSTRVILSFTKIDFLPIRAIFFFSHIHTLLWHKTSSIPPTTTCVFFLLFKPATIYYILMFLYYHIYCLLSMAEERLRRMWDRVCSWSTLELDLMFLKKKKINNYEVFVLYSGWKWRKMRFCQGLFFPMKEFYRVLQSCFCQTKRMWTAVDLVCLVDSLH